MGNNCFDIDIKSNLLFSDDFRFVSNSWTTAGGCGIGKWEVEDGCLHFRCKSLGIHKRFSAILTKKSVSGLIREVSCDISFEYDNTVVDEAFNGFLLCADMSGDYYLRLAYYPDENNREKVILQLLKHVRGSHSYTVLTQSGDLKKAFGIAITPGCWFNLRVTLDKGVISAYIDGKKIFTHTDSEDYYTTGQVGLRPANCDAKYKNFYVLGEPAVINTAIPTPPPLPAQTYTYTFEDTPLQTRHITFCEPMGENNWSVTEKNGSKLLSTSGDCPLAETWIHGYETDPVIRASFYASPVRNHATAGVFARYGVDGSYLRVGYDFAKSKWYVSYKQGLSFEPTCLYAEKEDAFDTGILHELCVTIKEKTVIVSHNSCTVFASHNIPYVSYGRPGIYSEYTAIDVKSFSCDFPNGGSVTPGVITTTFFSDTYLNFLEVERISETDVIGFSFLYRALSTDKGATFTDVSRHPDYQQVNYSDDYSSILKMKNGKFLQFAAFDDFKVLESDDFKHWTAISRVLPASEQYAPLGKRIAIQHVSSPTQITLGNGKERIFMPICFRHVNERGSIVGHHSRVYYSDDCGYTWQASADTTERAYEGCSETTSISELKVLRCVDGTLRLYSTRNSKGCVCCFVSHDDGVTWPELVLLPELPCAMSSFGLAEDPSAPGTWFMVYVKNMPYNLPSLFPRTNLVLVKSTDGIHWEQLADLDRFDNVEGTISTEPYQILDPSITVCEDYIYAGWGRSSEATPSFHNAQRAHYIRIDRKAAGI